MYLSVFAFLFVLVVESFLLGLDYLSYIAPRLTVCMYILYWMDHGWMDGINSWSSES